MSTLMFGQPPTLLPFQSPPLLRFLSLFAASSANSLWDCAKIVWRYTNKAGYGVSLVHLRYGTNEDARAGQPRGSKGLQAISCRSCCATADGGAAVPAH